MKPELENAEYIYAESSKPCLSSSTQTQTNPPKWPTLVPGNLLTQLPLVVVWVKDKLLTQLPLVVIWVKDRLLCTAYSLITLQKAFS